MALAVYAAAPAHSRGRLFAEPEHPLRTAFQRDRDRIVHSTAFRRLEYKTQVFVNHVGDHYRTRLTHSLEVAQIARTLARALAVDEDLAEAIALAHDLGHSPFGHAGEAALDACLAGDGGFDHNVQTLRVLTRLEQRYAAFDGLNLTFETLEGVIKHNGPLDPTAPPLLVELAAQLDLPLAGQASLEAQVAAIADDVAYANHDLDDGLRAGMLDVAELRRLPLVGAALDDVERRHGGLEAERLVHETVRRVMDRMVTDLVLTSRTALLAAAPTSPDDVRRHGAALVGFSPAMRDAVDAIKAFLRQHLYRHYKVNRMTAKAKRVVVELFEAFVADPSCLPPRWAARTDGPGGARTRATVRDYIAGMTDRFALDEHARLIRLDDVRP
ncbi:MAG: deoxyguanosinetriphosphate triphosphohydrolase [Geminicoccaceae bacterium]|nr:MAG: deoxyguanosinetriphosphate triphosphohydrolase [Geminicoccaceae bacterium]